MVECIVKFDTLESTFIPRIFADKDWTELFVNFEDPTDELIKEFYANARFTEVELQCWVRGNKFIITLDYIAQLFHITRFANADRSPYDDRLPTMTDILRILGDEHEVSATGTSIGTAKFKPELKTLTFIMFFNLYPLSNTGFINLGLAQFLCDLITGAPIDICAHIFQTIGKTAAKMCLLFYDLLMKIILHEGISPPRGGKLLDRCSPISISSLKKSKSHFSVEWTKQTLPTPPKDESIQNGTHSGHGSVAHTIETTSSHIPMPPTISTQPGQSSSHAD